MVLSGTDVLVEVLAGASIVVGAAALVVVLVVVGPVVVGPVVVGPVVVGPVVVAVLAFGVAVVSEVAALLGRSAPPHDANTSIKPAAIVAARVGAVPRAHRCPCPDITTIMSGIHRPRSSIA